MKFLMTLTALIFSSLIFAQDYDVEYVDIPVKIQNLETRVGNRMSMSDVKILKVIKVITKTTTGHGVIVSTFGTRLTLKVRDIGQTKMFLINGALAYWGQTVNPAVMFKANDPQGNDIVEIMIAGSSTLFNITYLSNFQAVPPSHSNPNGFEADRYELEFMIGAN